MFNLYEITQIFFAEYHCKCNIIVFKCLHVRVYKTQM